MKKEQSFLWFLSLVKRGLNSSEPGQEDIVNVYQIVYIEENIRLHFVRSGVNCIKTVLIAMPTLITDCRDLHLSRLAQLVRSLTINQEGTGSIVGLLDQGLNSGRPSFATPPVDRDVNLLVKFLYMMSRGRKRTQTLLETIRVKLG